MKLPFRRPGSPMERDTKSLPSPIRVEAYADLPPESQAAYRPVDRRLERLPLICIILYALAGVSLVLYLAMQVSIPFADWFNRTVSAILRGLFATLTAWIPFSLGEFLLWMIPLGLFLVLRHAIRRRCDTWRTAFVFMGILGSVAAAMFSIFVLNFAAGYRTTPIEDQLELDRTTVTAGELYDTALILIENINRETAEIGFYAENFSEMPYGRLEMNKHLGVAYDAFAAEHNFLKDNPGRVKPVLMSEAMSYLHITGVYSFFTGEANINVNFPDYTIPYTAAHEMAHQRGVAREDEANFVAFLVCLESDDPYVRYSGYLNIYEFVSGALWNADRTLYYKANATLNDEVKHEMAAYSAFYDRYRESTVSNISSTINNSYLQSQGTPGTRSYGMVVELAVAYYRD